jgi:hypothetical protein
MMMKFRTCKLIWYPDFPSKRIRSSYSAGGFEVESSVSSSQGTTTLIVHNTSMGLISEEIEEDLQRLKSMDSDNSGFVIMYTVPPPPPKHDPVKDKKDVFWERCKLKNVRNAKKQSSSEHIFIRVEDYDEMQNTREAEVNLKGNLDLPSESHFVTFMFLTLLKIT